MANSPNVVWLEHLRRADVPLVGGKNASLGELVRTLSTEGVRVPPGFATTADAYWRFVDENVLRSRVNALLADHEARKLILAEVGQAIRIAFLHGEWPSDSPFAFVGLGPRNHRPSPDDRPLHVSRERSRWRCLDDLR
jgi:pyruvate,water dikinase